MTYISHSSIVKDRYLVPTHRSYWLLNTRSKSVRRGKSVDDPEGLEYANEPLNKCMTEYFAKPKVPFEMLNCFYITIICERRAS